MDKAISEMIEFCEQEDITSFAELLDYAKDYKYEWFKVLCGKGTIIMKEYLRTRKQKEEKNYG